MKKLEANVGSLTDQQNLMLCEVLYRVAGEGWPPKRVLELRRLLVRETKALNRVTASAVTTPSKSQ